MLTPLLLAITLAAPRPYTALDQVTLRRVSSLRASPDGKSVVFVLRSTDLEKNKGTTDLWLVGSEGSPARALTTHPDSESDPEWSGDGRHVYFLSGRSGSRQVWRIAIDGGEAEQVTRVETDIESFHVSPNGKTIVFSAYTFPDCPDLSCTTKRLAAKSAASGLLYDSLFVRHWDHFRDGTRQHLFVTETGSVRPPRDLMPGLNQDAPTMPFGDASEYTFTPDAKAVVFTTRDYDAKDPSAMEPVSTNLNLYVVTLDGKSRPRVLTGANPAADAMPRFSPDGKLLAYARARHPKYESDKMTVVVRQWGTDKDQELTAGLDRSAAELEWARDGKSLYITADHLGQQVIFQIDATSGAATQLTQQGSASGVAAIGGGAVVYSLDTLKAPADLWVRWGDGSNTQLTNVNDEALAQIQMGDYEQFDFVGAGGDKVYGYVVKPVGFQAGKKYPLAFLIHGGPQGSFGNHFHYRWNPQAYAGKGFVAVMIDFHGSTGYGQAFTDSIRGDWGGKPLEDLKLGLEAVLKKYSFIDGKRACALGASYGGFMINWMAGNFNEPWRCFVNHDGNLDEKMAYYDTEELWFPEWEHNGTPWENPDGYNKHNPVDHVAKWKVPMLVVHGGKDYRVVDTQGLSTFTVLQRKGIPSKLLYFPDENHWVLKPHNSLLWHETVLDWLQKWTK